MAGALKAMWEGVLRFLDLPSLEFESVVISPAAIGKICGLARETAPKEFIAILQGSVTRKVLSVDDVIFQPFSNTRYSSSVRIDLPLGTTAVGSVHSHPGPGNSPSQQDLRFFSKMGGVHIIICSPFRKTDIKLYLGDGTPLHYHVGGSERKH